MLKIEVAGSAIGGEDARENKWIDQIARASDLADVSLHFRLEPKRNIDIDNLVRPAMRGLKKSGYYRNGFPNLQSISAVKQSGSPFGLVVEKGILHVPGKCLLRLEWGSVPPSDATTVWKTNWTSAIQKNWHEPVICEPVWLSILTTSSRSLVDLLKPVIDGLEPFLGRDPNGRNTFCPNDHLIEWLQIRRVKTGPPLAISAGLIR